MRRTKPAETFLTRATARHDSRMHTANVAIDLLAKHGCIVSPEAAAHIAKQEEPERYIQQILGAFLEVPFHLALSDLQAAEATVQAAAVPTSGATHGASMRQRRTVSARDHDAEVEILVDAKHVNPPKGDLQGFVRYFNDRYDVLSKMLRRRREVSNAVPIKQAADAGRDVQFIGLVSDVGKGKKNGHRFLEIEDQTGSLTALVPSNRPDLVALADSLLPDEVIGVVAKAAKAGTLLIVDGIVRPDLPFRANQRPPLEVPLQVAFLGDVHLGSKTFLKPSFRRMIRWMRGDIGTDKEQTVAQSIKYLVLPGDIVDGVGVYPGQEAALEIPDVLEQYRQLSLELESLPEHVHVVLMPGNHDASRPSEPQLAFDNEIRGYFDSIDATFVSNPSTFSLHGRRVLMYHGFSMIDFATKVPGMRMDEPIPIMEHMLQCRHLAPAYGAKTPVAPAERDLMTVQLEPDIFATGHVHVTGLGNYKGVSLVNGGTWQSQTDYQRMHNLMPTPARMPVLNLDTLAASQVDFGPAT